MLSVIPGPRRFHRSTSTSTMDVVVARSTKTKSNTKGKKTPSKGKKDDKIVSKLNAVSVKDETKNKEEHIGNIDEDLCATITKPWSEIKKNRETFANRVRLGLDVYKLANFSSETAREYMAVKPVPVVKYRGYYYVVDHHHTLSALELAGWEVDVTLEEIYVFEDDLNEGGVLGHHGRERMVVL